MYITWNGHRQHGLYKGVIEALVKINETPCFGGVNDWAIKCPNGDTFIPTKVNGVFVL